MPGALAGHMAGAEKVLRRRLKDVDLVWEVVDARCPRASRNPRLGRLCGGKPRLLVLAKADLASEAATLRWLGWFRGRGQAAVAVDALRGAGLVSLRAASGELAAARSAVRPDGVRVMVVGIPNVGKSSLVNRVVGRRGAPTGARPGVTRGAQWVRSGEVAVLDLPGVLPPRIAGEEATWRLAAVGALAEALYDGPACARRLLSEIGGPEAGGPDDAAVGALEALGRRRGMLSRGGVVDVERAAAHVLAAFRRGDLGAHTLEEPPVEADAPGSVSAEELPVVADAPGAVSAGELPAVADAPGSVSAGEPSQADAPGPAPEEPRGGAATPAPVATEGRGGEVATQRPLGATTVRGPATTEEPRG